MPPPPAEFGVLLRPLSPGKVNDASVTLRTRRAIASSEVSRCASDFVRSLRIIVDVSVLEETLSVESTSIHSSFRYVWEDNEGEVAFVIVILSLRLLEFLLVKNVRLKESN